MASKVVDKDIVSPHIQDFNNDEHFVSFQCYLLLRQILHMTANKQLIPVVVFHEGIFKLFGICLRREYYTYCVTNVSVCLFFIGELQKNAYSHKLDQQECLSGILEKSNTH